MSGFDGLELFNRGRNRIAFGLLLRALAIERSELGPKFFGLLGQELPLHGDEVWARARGRLKGRFRIVAVAQRRAQSRDVQLRGNQIAFDMLLAPRSSWSDRVRSEPHPP